MGGADKAQTNMVGSDSVSHCGLGTYSRHTAKAVATPATGTSRVVSRATSRVVWLVLVLTALQ